MGDQSKTETGTSQINLPYEGISDVFNESIYTNQGNQGSYSKLKTMTAKHIRESRDPNQIYDVCITDNQNYGWNIKRGKAKDGDSQDDLSWAACPPAPAPQLPNDQVRRRHGPDQPGVLP